ncbi:MAG: hypothetical protein GXO75_16480 [Calditrichaeota bacterium]|nr:hypothetical protein [Calditrichota bacterium]
MKHITSVIIFLFLGVATSNAQNSSKVSFEISFNKMCLGYQFNFDKAPIWSKAYIGLGNQDINKEFNDVLSGIKIGTPFFSFTNSKVYGDFNTGIYIPNNKYYNATTLFIGIDIGYEMFFGTQKRHSLFTEIGYLYGQREYIQALDNETLFISTKDVFKLYPINFSLGYGFGF